MILNSTFYKNPQRTIIGLLNPVSNADTIILCDTSVGAVSLQLLEIPNDQWNTTYKLYVVDKSNNASVNNITIVAPVGFTINNLSTLVISTNGGGVLIRVASNTGYLGSLTSGGSGASVSVVNNQTPIVPPTTLTTNLNQLIVKGFQTTNVGNNVTLQNAFVSLTNAQINFLISGGTLIPNQIYQITDALFGLTPIAFNVYVKATSVNSLDTYGSGQFFNADYNNIGDYSGVSGFVAQKGVWSSIAFPVVAGDVAIWNNFHWKNLTGSNGFNPPNLDPTNWTILPYSATNGYLIEYDLIGYDNQTNRINWRKDKLNNYVEYYTDSGSGGTGFNSLNKFQWGNAKSSNNQVIDSSLFDNCNVIVDLLMSNNFLSNYNLTLSQPNLSSKFKFFWNNQFIKSSRSAQIFGNDLNVKFINNVFLNVGINQMVLNGVAIISENFFNLATINITLTNASIQVNNFDSSSFQISKSGGGFQSNSILQSAIAITNSTGIESDNEISFSQITITSNNAGLIQKNNLQNESYIQINLQDGTGDIVGNSFENGSGLIIAGLNSGSILQNNFQNKSYLEINNQDINGVISYNSLDNGSYYLITGLNSGQIGNGGVKGLGNTLTNGSSCTFVNVGSLKEIYRNNFVSSEINIQNFDGAINNCQFTGSVIQLGAMNSQTLVGLTLTLAKLGSLVYVLPQTFPNGEYIKGNASIQANLDCSNPLIYDLANLRLTIPNELKIFAGVYNLVNAGGLLIAEIVNINSEIITTFKNNGGTTNFQVAGVGVAIPNEIIGDATIPAIFGLVYRLNGQDSVQITRLGVLNGVSQLNIYV